MDALTSKLFGRAILRFHQNHHRIVQICRHFSKPSYIHNIGTEPLKYMTLGKLLEETANAHGRREAVVAINQGKILSFGDVLEQADKLAAGLRKLGVERGDRVGLWAPNLVEWFLTYLACARGGFVISTINPAYQSTELEYCIKKVGIKVLVCSESFKSTNYYALLQKIHPSLPNDEPSNLKCKQIPTLKSIVFISSQSWKGTYNFEEVLKMAEDNVIKQIKANQHLIDPDMGCNIQFTSGTTGNPKAILATHFNIVNNSYEIVKRLELDKKYHRVCLQAPLFHALGSSIACMGALNVAATMVFTGPTYNPISTLETCEQEGCTAIHGTPTMYVDLVNIQKQKNFKLKLETAVIGGATCSPELLKQIKEVLKINQVQIVYGLTETTAVVFQSRPEDTNDEYKSTQTVGYVSNHIEAKVIDENDRIVPIGTPGELCVRGYCATLGYWGNEEKTKELIGADRWIRTGDKFVLQEDGYGRIVGRIKDMIIRGGENIFPKEIEDFLDTHPNILESQVIGITHERLGEEVCACVRLKNDANLTLEELEAFCKGKIASYKIPRHLKIYKEFPKTASGKVQKFKLREENY